MAIKGKARRRARSKGVHSPPKPLITPKKVPFPARKDVRHALAVVLGLVVMLGGLRVWQNDVRADALAAYHDTLRRVTTVSDVHLGAEGDTAIDPKAREFTEGKLGGAAFLKLADQWEKDFTKTRDEVRTLKPPKQVNAAEDWLVEGLEGFIGAARLFNVAAQQRQFADLPAQAKLRQKLEDQVQVVILHANEMLTRARGAYQKGTDILDSYLSAWHVSDSQSFGAVR